MPTRMSRMAGRAVSEYLFLPSGTVSLGVFAMSSSKFSYIAFIRLADARTRREPLLRHNSVDNNFYEVKRHGIIQHCNSELSGADGPRGFASSLVAAKCYPGNSVPVSRCSYAYGRNILHGVL